MLIGRSYSKQSAAACDAPLFAGEPIGTQCAIAKKNPVLLCRYGEDVDFVKVLDFGLVKAFAQTTDLRVSLTRDHVVQGTPAFMAPEQALGGAEVDARADIYATGCLAYWLLTGQFVFSADTPIGMLIHHASTPPEPPSTQTEFEIPEELNRLVLSCLAKDPANRPQSARELSQRLGDIKTPHAWTVRRAHDWWETHLPPV